MEPNLGVNENVTEIPLLGRVHGNGCDHDYECGISSFFCIWVVAHMRLAVSADWSHPLRSHWHHSRLHLKTMMRTTTRTMAPPRIPIHLVDGKCNKFWSFYDLSAHYLPHLLPRRPSFSASLYLYHFLP